MSLIFDEGQLIDQWQNRNILRWQEGYIATKGNKSAPHIELINVFVHNFSDGCEALKFLGLVIFQLRGIKDDPISRMHSFQRRGFAMICLDKSVSYSALQVIF